MSLAARFFKSWCAFLPWLYRDNGKGNENYHDHIRGYIGIITLTVSGARGRAKLGNQSYRLRSSCKETNKTYSPLG